MCPCFSVPEERKAIDSILDRITRYAGHPKSGIVLEPLKQHLSLVAPITLGESGPVKMNLAAGPDIYRERLDP